MITPEQLHILQHSLGVDKYGRGQQYRNRYVTGPECDNFQACEDLVSKGFMHDHGSMKVAGGMHCFMVTCEGVKYMQVNSPKPPKLTPGHKRYKEWLKVADCFPDWEFGDWLKFKKQEAA